MNKGDTKELLSDYNITTKTKTKPNFVVVLAASILFGTMLVVAFGELIVALYRNTHILGFIIAFIQFFICIALLVLLTLYYHKGEFSKKIWLVFQILFGVSIVFFLLTSMFLSVKMMQFSQEPSRATDFKNNQIFTKECQNTIKSCSEIGIQSRVEGSKVVHPQGAALYVQTSHTDFFLGLIVDGVYWAQIGPAPEDADSSISFPGDVASIYVRCNKRIASAPRKCKNLWKDFEKCLTKDENKNFLKCVPQAP